MLVHPRWRSVAFLTSSCKFQLRRNTWKNFTLEDDLTLEIKKSIEKKWSKHVYGVKCPAELSKTNKPIQETSKYILSMFPYPSGKLHLGHVRVYTLSDVISRFYRLKGYHVIHPMGWDAFGLPAENAARDHNIEPEKWTRDNIKYMKDQLIGIGCCFDWNREFATCDPSYYKWTQWLFIKLWENGLAYKKRAHVFWDPVDQTVLAEEQVDSEMRSWRSGAKVEKKLLSQWFVKTSVFAKDLMAELESGNLKDGWRDVIDLQKHWVGDIKGKCCETDLCIKDFLSEADMSTRQTTEPIRIWFSDTAALTKAKYFILRSDHFLSVNENSVSKTLPNGSKLLKFKLQNPLTGKSLPVITGPVEIMPLVPESSDCRIDEIFGEELGDLSKNEAELSAITEFLKQELEEVTDVGNCSQDEASAKVQTASLKLRDWLVSRQRKWGTPIPIVNCLDCGHSAPVPFEMLPISQDTILNDICPKCQSKNLELEKDTLDTFFDSSWYFLRYLDPSNESKIFEPQKLQNSLPVDVYVGGKEHATLHLYYARFMSHFIHSLGLISKKEPFRRLIPIGVVMGESYSLKDSGKYIAPTEAVKNDENKFVEKATGKPVVVHWEKMSKSKYNGIDPQVVLEEFGIDTTRLLSISEAAPTSPRNWPPNNLTGFLNWQHRLWLLMRQFENEKDFGEIQFIDDEDWANSEAKIFDARNFYLKGITFNYADTNQISVVVTRLQGLLGALKSIPGKYIKESIEFERALGTLIITSYPILPAFSAQLWQSFRAVATHTEAEYDLYKEVWEQSWPEVDQSYELDLICNVNGHEITVKIERQYFDGMDEDTALEYAFEEEGISSLVKRESTQVVSYIIEPGYRATLTLYDPTSEVLTKKMKKKIKQAEKAKRQKQSKIEEAESKV